MYTVYALDADLFLISYFILCFLFVIRYSWFYIFFIFNDNIVSLDY